MDHIIHGPLSAPLVRACHYPRVYCESAGPRLETGRREGGKFQISEGGRAGRFCFAVDCSSRHVGDAPQPYEPKISELMPRRRQTRGCIPETSPGSPGRSGAEFARSAGGGHRPPPRRRLREIHRAVSGRSGRSRDGRPTELSEWDAG